MGLQSRASENPDTQKGVISDVPAARGSWKKMVLQSRASENPDAQKDVISDVPTSSLASSVFNELAKPAEWEVLVISIKQVG